MSILRSLGFGGILLDPKSEPTEEDPRLRIVGSTMVVEAESIEKARELIESDIYYKTGVVCVCHSSEQGLGRLIAHCTKWDTESLVIVPFIPATPLP